MRAPRDLERLIITSLNDDDCPSSELLADYMLSALDPTDQLQVAAHVRDCPLCQQLMAICAPPTADDLLQVAAETITPRIRFPLRIAKLLPSAPALGMRGSEDHVRHYRSANIAIELTWTPPDGDIWHLTGRILRDDVPLDNQVITLRYGRRQFIATSDTLGFFSFSEVSSGRYLLSVIADGVEVQLRNIELRHDSP